MAKRIIRLTESELTKLIKNVIKEQQTDVIKCITDKITKGELKSPPFDIGKFTSVMTDVGPVIQACLNGPFTPDCMKATMTFTTKHSQDAMELLPYVMTNISIISPCFLQTGS